jgi:hypothetical protein
VLSNHEQVLVRISRNHDARIGGIAGADQWVGQVLARWPYDR